MVMSHRERALAALSHKEPDRVPLDLGSTRNTGIIIEAYDALLEYLEVDEIVERDNYGYSKVNRVVKPSETVLQRFGIDFRGVFYGKPDLSTEEQLADNCFKDELGIVRTIQPGSFYYIQSEFPLDGDITKTDIKEWKWPNPDDPGYVRGIRDRTLEIRKNIDCAITLHTQDIIVHPSQFLRGYESWYMDFILQPDLIEYLLDTILDVRIAVAVNVLKEVGDIIDVVASSDDVAENRGSIVSPEMYRKFIKPRHRKYFDSLRSHTSAKIHFHTCGSVEKMIPDFIDLGIDAINPVQVSAGNMDNTAWLKREYGDKITFWGAIDNVQVLPHGSPEQVKLEVKKRINDLGPGGGYVLAAIHNIQPDVSPENIVTMFDSAIEYGTYPIEES
jgi:uroporphyrinogen decarboxylase